MTISIPQPQAVLPEAIFDTHHGVRVGDPFRWLEDSFSPNTRLWLSFQMRNTNAYFRGLAGLATLKNRISELFSGDTIDSPWQIASEYYFLKRRATEQQPSIYVRHESNGMDEALVSPSSVASSLFTSIEILRVSANSRLLAFGVRVGGEDTISVRILDIPSRRILPDCLPRGLYRNLFFSPDGRGYYYAQENVEENGPGRHEVRWHEIGTDVGNDPTIFLAGTGPDLKLGFRMSWDCSFAAYSVRCVGDNAGRRLYVQDLPGRTTPRPIDCSPESCTSLVFVDDELFAVARNNASNGRIIAWAVNPQGRKLWREVVPEGRYMIQQFMVCGNKLFVSYTEDLATVTRVFDISGRHIDSLTYPEHGTAQMFPCEPTSTDLFYKYSSFGSPPTIFVYSTKTGESRIWVKAEGLHHKSDLTVTKLSCRASDGTSIPVTLVRDGNRRRSLPEATVMTAYGGFGRSMTPEFSLFSWILFELGCTFAVAITRGGSEFGHEWQAAGKGRFRIRVVQDFLSCAAFLVEQGLSSPQCLAAAGGSNGGWLVAAAIVTQPKLFAAAICQAPLLDMLRYRIYGRARFWTEDIGSPDNPRDFESLLACSPYHQVRDEVSYPAVLMVSGDSDERCHPMHARKMIARLQHASSSNRPILLDYIEERGHSPALPIKDKISSLTRKIAFLADQLRIPIPLELSDENTHI